MKNCFIIVNCNDYKSTEHLINNIKHYKCLDKIVIVDNASDKEEREMLKTLKSSKVDLIYNDENLGYSYGINVASKYLIRKYKKCNLIISNSDIVIVDEDDLIALIDVLNDETIGAVGPQILELGKINRGVKFISPIMDVIRFAPVLKNFCSEKKFLYNNHLYDSNLTDVDVITSSFFLIRSDILERINYLDEKVFLYYEDFILAKKIKNINVRIVVVNSVKIKHLYSVTVDKLIKSLDKYILYKNSQMYYHTTYNNASYFDKLILRFSKFCGLLIREKNR